jgi:energy-coupling factor transporter transmembrane protein EcfT
LRPESTDRRVIYKEGVGALKRLAFTGEDRIKFDPVTALLIVLLAATLLAFLTGLFPYPVGWIVITALLVFRLTGGQTKS